VKIYNKYIKVRLKQIIFVAKICLNKLCKNYILKKGGERRKTINKKVENIMLKIKENLSILDILVFLILGIAFAVLSSYYNKGYGEFSTNILVFGVVLSALFMFLWIFFRLIIIFIDSRNTNTGKINIIFNKNKNIYKYRLIILALIILLCWMPVLIGLYPGTFSNDTWKQVSQFYYLRLGGNLNDAHPVLDTLLIGSLIVPLSTLTGNWHLFMFLYVIIQAIATSLVFAYSLVYAKEKLKLNNKFIIIFLQFIVYYQFFLDVYKQ